MLSTAYERFKNYWKGMIKSPSVRACVVMTAGLCSTFVGYEYSRAASITLLAAEETGLGNEALPLTIAVGSPASALVLYLYTKSIKRLGSQTTLRISNIVCLIMFFFMFLYCGQAKGLTGKIIVVCFYAAREIYVSLISSQQWAFISTSLDKSTSSYLVSFSGIVSVASAIGGCTVEQLVTVGGMRGLLFTTFIATLIGTLCAEVASMMLASGKAAEAAAKAKKLEEESEASKAAEVAASLLQQQPVPAPDNGQQQQQQTVTKVPSTDNNNNNNSNAAKSEPIKRQQSFLPASNLSNLAKQAAASLTTATTSTTTTPATTSSSSSSHHNHHHNHHHHHNNKKKQGFWQDSWSLICSHSILQLLFFEAITHQTCTNMLNIMFHNGLRFTPKQEMGLYTDDFKAKLVGRFFATVNIVACLLQCFVLPIVLSQATLPKVMKRLPFIVFLGTIIGAIYPGLVSVMLGFGTMKVLEYSIMHSASEMIYMPLGHEVRYVGKELVKFFGHKLGKSGASLVLTACISHLQPSLRMQSIWGAVFTIVWGISVYCLANSLQERNQLDDLQEEEQRLQQAQAQQILSHRRGKHHNSSHGIGGGAGEIPTSRSMSSFEIIPSTTTSSADLQQLLSNSEEEIELLKESLLSAPPPPSPTAVAKETVDNKEVAIKHQIVGTSEMIIAAKREEEEEEDPALRTTIPATAAADQGGRASDVTVDTAATAVIVAPAVILETDETTTNESESPPNFAWYHGSESEDSPERSEQYARSLQQAAAAGGAAAGTTESTSNTPTSSSSLRQRRGGTSSSSSILKQSSAYGKNSLDSNNNNNDAADKEAPATLFNQAISLGMDWSTTIVYRLTDYFYPPPKRSASGGPIMLKVGSAQVSLDSLDKEVQRYHRSRQSRSNSAVSNGSSSNNYQTSSSNG